MRHLIGQSFPLADRTYLIVDVRQVAGDAMIYAEPLPVLPGQPLAAGGGHRARAAFHYRDIAVHLAPPETNAPGPGYVTSASSNGGTLGVL
jgi:hypothetical protein